MLNRFALLGAVCIAIPVGAAPRKHPNSRREVAVEVTSRGQKLVRSVSPRRRDEIACVVDNMAVRERHGLVPALTAFTTAGDEPEAHIDIDDQTF